MKHRQNLELVFVDYSSNFSPSDFNYAYHTVIQETETQEDLPFIKIIHGDITRWTDHYCEAIINAANMEVQFGKGISGAIRKAVGEQGAAEIELFVREKIRYFNQKVLIKLGNQSHVFSGTTIEPVQRDSGSHSSSSDLPPVPVVLPEPKTFRSWQRSNHLPPQDPYFSDRCDFPKNTGIPALSSVEALRNALASAATPSPTEMIWYRWGQKLYEEDRIHLIPAFNISSRMNIGGSVMGKGLYVASTPTASASYGNSLRDAKLITIRAKKGTPFLDLTHPNTITNIIQRLGVPNLDVQKLVANCNPPVMVKYMNIADAGVGSWWVLKYTKGVVVEDFDGKYISTQELFNYKNLLKQSRYLTAHDHYWDSLKLTLKRRIYNPSNPQRLPVTLTSMVPLQDWVNYRRLKKLDTNIYIQGQKPQYFWRYDGTCGEYFRDGLILSEDDVNPDHCRAHFPTILTREDNNKCIEKVRGEHRIVVANTNHATQDCEN